MVNCGTLQNITFVTDKEEIFCNQYILDCNGSAAAVRAGYSENASRQQAYELLKKEYIQDRISELQEARAKRTEITQDRVLQEYAKIAFFDIRKLVDDNGCVLPIGDLDDNTAGAIAGIEVQQSKESAGDETFSEGVTIKVKISDKRAALDSISKMQGYFEKDNQQKRETTQVFNIGGQEISF